jgi:hypothetical protein
MGSPRVSRQVGGTSVVQTGLEDGRWYWRVTPVFPQSRNSIAPSGIENFTIVRGSSAPAAPQLTAPVQNGTLSLENPRLLWKHDAAVSSWTVEVADNSQLSNPVVQQTVNSNYYTVPSAALQEGKSYYWRVSAVNGSERSVSVVRAFTTAGNTWEQRAVFPPDNYVLTEGALEAIRFSYASNVPFQNYLQISSQENFASTAINEPVEGPRGTRSISLNPGTWYWRITADSGRGALSSPARRITIVPAVVVAPVIEPEPELEPEPEPVPEPVPEIVVAPVVEIPAVWEAPLPPPPPPAPPPPPPPPPVVAAPPPVAAAAPAPPSAPPRMSRAARAAYRPISSLYPPNRYTVSKEALDAAQTVDFNWDGSETQFRFSLRRADGEVVVAPVQVNGTTYTLRNPGRLAVGDYTWVVESAQGSSSANFTITESPPVIRTLPTTNPGVLYGNR